MHRYLEYLPTFDRALGETDDVYTALQAIVEEGASASVAVRLLMLRRHFSLSEAGRTVIESELWDAEEVAYLTTHSH